MTTDELAAKLKRFVVHNDEIYFLSIRPHSTRSRWNVEYKSNNNNLLFNTWRSGKTMHDALRSMFEFMQTVSINEPDNILEHMINNH